MEPAGVVGRGIEDAEEEKVVSHDVHALGTPDHATCRGEVLGQIRTRRFQMQGPDMTELQGRKVLCTRDAAVHSRGLPAKAGRETRGSMSAERVRVRP